MADPVTHIIVVEEAGQIIVSMGKRFAVITPDLINVFHIVGVGVAATIMFGPSVYLLVDDRPVPGGVTVSFYTLQNSNHNKHSANSKTGVKRIGHLKFAADLTVNRETNGSNNCQDHGKQV